jgi:hypothetical protein
MDLALLDELRSPAGQTALALAVELAPDESTLLSCSNRLRKLFPPALAGAALETALLRRRARGKFRLAERMFFTREALEQASAEAVARHRARRFAGLGAVADLCCGIGGDALALAGHAAVVAVDRDPLRLAMAGLNLAAYGLRERATLLQRDALALGPVHFDGAFADPDRRVGGRRVLSTRDCEPPLPDLVAALPAGLPLGVKLAPAVPLAELEPYGGEVEFVSLDGELKECVLWSAALRTAWRRATILPGGHTLWTEGPAPPPPPGPPCAWLYDPDPAVVRAGLVADLAGRLGARALDAGIAYLTTDERVPTPFARLFAVEAALPFHLRRLRDYLRQRRVGRVQVTRRGSAVDPAELERKLRLEGDEARTLVLTRVLGRPHVLVTRPERA